MKHDKNTHYTVMFFIMILSGFLTKLKKHNLS